MEKNLVIKKAELKKDGTLDAQFYKKEGEDYFLVSIKKNKRVRHPDLDDAFEALEKHLQAISGIKEEFTISSITNALSSKDKTKVSIVITGQYVISINGKIININTPAIEFADDLDYYDDMDELIKCSERCDEEVRAYIKGDKQAQQKIPFNEGEDGDKQE